VSKARHPQGSSTLPSEQSPERGDPCQRRPPRTSALVEPTPWGHHFQVSSELRALRRRRERSGTRFGRPSPPLLNRTPMCRSSQSSESPCYCSTRITIARELLLRETQ
jgi:hypothetical protein